MNSPGNAERRPQPKGGAQTEAIPTPQYTPLECAAALARATLAHLTEALAEREQGKAFGPPRELIPSVAVARWLADDLAALAESEVASHDH